MPHDSFLTALADCFFGSLGAVVFLFLFWLCGFADRDWDYIDPSVERRAIIESSNVQEVDS